MEQIICGQTSKEKHFMGLSVCIRKIEDALKNSIKDNGIS